MPAIVIETFRNVGEPSSEHVRVRPLPGQIDEDCRVWCSTSQRTTSPIGSYFLVQATWVFQDVLHRQRYLRVGLKERWELLTPAQAKATIARLQGCADTSCDLRSSEHMYTPWFPNFKYDPQRIGTYETCAWPGADIARCYWDGEKWFASVRLVDRLNPAYWRGLTVNVNVPFPVKSRRERGSLMLGTAKVRTSTTSSPKNAWLYEDDGA